MPTQPNESFVPRSHIDPGIQGILNEYSNALEELVNFGSCVAAWSTSRVHGGEELAPLFLSFRHIFELIDAISVLVKNSSIEPCKILLRAIFESVLTVKYILKKDSQLRGKDFMACSWHHALNELRKMDPDDSMHKELVAAIQLTDYMKGVRLPELPRVKEMLESINEHLASPEYAESEKEYQRIREATGRKPDWYSMHEGPMNIRGLAEHVGSLLDYEILYREWSRLIHGFDIIFDNVEVVKYNEAALSQIRLPKNAYEVTKTTMQFGLEIIPHFIKIFAPEKDQDAKKWYREEIDPLNSGVLLINRIIVR